MSIYFGITVNIKKIILFCIKFAFVICDSKKVFLELISYMCKPAHRVVCENKC